MATITNMRLSRSWPALRLKTELLEPLFVVLTVLGIIAGWALRALDAAPQALLVVNLATYVFGGTFAVRAIIAAVREWKIEVDLLMVLAALGAAYVNAWTEGAILLFLFSLSNVLQHYAMRRTRQAIASLMHLRPDVVTVRRGDQLVTLALDAVSVGDVIVLRPGDRVAVDAVISR